MKVPHGLQDILAPHLRVVDVGLMVSFHGLRRFAFA